MFFIRRLRYMFSGKIIRGIFAVFSICVTLIFCCLFLFGFINQRSLFTAIFNTTAKGANIVAEEIENIIENDSSILKITDQGIYIKGFEPESTTYSNKDETISDFIDELRSTVEEEIGEIEKIEDIDTDSGKIEKDPEINSEENTNEDLIPQEDVENNEILEEESSNVIEDVEENIIKETEEE